MSRSTRSLVANLVQLFGLCLAITCLALISLPAAGVAVGAGVLAVGVLMETA